jgi:hypothetical protein
MANFDVQLGNWELGWEAALVITIGGVTLSLIFRETIVQLAHRCNRIRLGNIAIDFGHDVDRAERAMDDAPEIQNLRVEPITESASAGDVVLDGKDMLERTLEEVLKAKGVEAPAGAVTEQALQVLLKQGLIDAQGAGLIRMLISMGEDYERARVKRLAARDASRYYAMARAMVHWLRLAVLPHVGTGEPPMPRRKTRVGGYGVFAAPSSGSPSAVLVALDGPLKGHRYGVDRERFTLGSGRENDLVVSGDDYVSGRHAHIRFEDGTLFLRDDGSRNGTFVDDRRLSETAASLSVGDRIRVGESTFKVELPAD